MEVSGPITTTPGRPSGGDEEGHSFDRLSSRRGGLALCLATHSIIHQTAGVPRRENTNALYPPAHPQGVFWGFPRPHQGALPPLESPYKSGQAQNKPSVRGRVGGQPSPLYAPIFHQPARGIARGKVPTLFTHRPPPHWFFSGGTPDPTMVALPPLDSPYKSGQARGH